MLGWLKKLLGVEEQQQPTTTPDTPALSTAHDDQAGDDPAAPRPEQPPAWPSRCDTLVLYAVETEGRPPDTRTESLVVEYLDPVDELVVFEAEPAPGVHWWSRTTFEQRMERMLGDEATPLRDPNSSARLHWVQRWVSEHDPDWIAFQLEPSDIAGNGTAFQEGCRFDPVPPPEVV